MNIMIFLKKYMQKKIIRPIDFYFAEFISKKNNILMLVAACVSYEYSNGHVFLPIEYFEKNCFFSSINKNFLKKIIIIIGSKINWSKELMKHSSVSNGSIITPLVLFNKKIYLYKMWKAEKNIASVLYEKNKKNKINQKKCSIILDNLFFNQKKSSQKIAVALTLINDITFIIGGPGTGKTTTILKIIIALIKNSKKTIKIQLCAPTGKATTRLTEVIKNNIFNLYLSEKEKKQIPSKAVTIHELLGIEKISQKSFFNKNNLLDLNVLIIDETSMIDLLIMEKIFFSVPKDTKLIFIGDHNQICPIEAGSVLKNIANYADNGYSLKNLSILKKLTQSIIFNKINKKKTEFISDKICVLKKNYRFKKNSGIYTLSDAICKNKKNIIKDLFKNSIKNVFFHEIKNFKNYTNMIEKISLNYKSFWEKIYKGNKIEEIINTFQHHQVLCVVYESIFGVHFINKTLEDHMHKNSKIKYYYINDQKWYIGKPIMISKNNKYLDLYNGNIGITNMNKEGFLQVSFLKNNNIVQNIPVNILRNYETAWAITIHKAQGSEFINTNLILPNFDSKVLNKDILYTGVTRSQKQLNIFSNKKIFMKAVFKNTDRRNSLIETINDLKK